MEISKKRWLSLALLFTACAIGVHIYLAQQHYSLLFGLGSAPSICNVNEVFNCDAVSASKYSVFLGIPMAIWGACTNAVLFVLLALSYLGWTDDETSMGRYAFWVAALTAGASVVMFSISKVFLGTYCLFCISAYALSALQLISLWLGTEKVSSFLAGDLTALFKTQKTVLVLLLAVPAGAYFVNASAVHENGFDQMQTMAAEKVALWRTSPEKTFNNNLGLVWAEKTSPAKMTVVEFADFLCPHCKHASPTLNAFAQSHPDVRLVFKTYPLDATCNPGLHGPAGDGIRCVIAKAVICAEKLNHAGWSAHDYFFENQDQIGMLGRSDKILEMYCSAKQVDCAALQTCIEAGSTLDELKATAQEGADIEGTPTVFVNGRKLNGGQLLPVLEEAYRAL